MNELDNWGGQLFRAGSSPCWRDSGCHILRYPVGVTDMDDIQFKRVMLNLAALLVVGIFLTSLLKHYL
jgi:hypothetical protein